MVPEPFKKCASSAAWISHPYTPPPNLQSHISRFWVKCIMGIVVFFCSIGERKRERLCVLYLHSVQECGSTGRPLAPTFCFYSPRTGSSLWWGLIHVVWERERERKADSHPPTPTSLAAFQHKHTHTHTRKPCFLSLWATVHSPLPPPQQRFIYSSNYNKQAETTRQKAASSRSRNYFQSTSKYHFKVTDDNTTRSVAKFLAAGSRSADNHC